MTGHNRSTGYQGSDVPPWLPILYIHWHTWLQGKLNIVCTTAWGEDKWKFDYAWTLMNSALFSFADFNLYHFAVMGFPRGSAGKESTCNVGDLGLIPGLARSPGEGKGYPLYYYSLENSLDCLVQGVTKSLTQLSGFHFHFLFAVINYNCYHESLLDLCESF